METKSYTYKRYMRDGTVKEITAVVRTKKKKKQEKPENVQDKR